MILNDRNTKANGLKSMAEAYMIICENHNTYKTNKQNTNRLKKTALPYMRKLLNEEYNRYFCSSDPYIVRIV